MHKHKHCHHVMQYCEVCDVAYCEKCGKEWGNRPYYPYWGTYTYTVKDTGQTNTVCNHSK